MTKGEKDKFVDVLSLFEYFVDLGIHGYDQEELKENPSEIWTCFFSFGSA